MPDNTNITPVLITTENRAGRMTASSGSKWEPIMGYSRAVRSGNIIAVTGTVGVGGDGKYSPDLSQQTRSGNRIPWWSTRARDSYTNVRDGCLEMGRGR
jgi:hypothetical protein